MLLIFSPFLFYHLLFETLMHGQSPGKRALNIRVVRLNGLEAGTGNYLLRWLLSPIDIYLLSGSVAIVSIIMGKKGQRLGDMAAGTTVIKVAKSSAFLKNHAINQVRNDYEPVYPQAILLDADYISLIQKAIDVKLNLLNEKPVNAIAEKTRIKLGITAKENDLKFLHTILKDYHFLASRSMAE